ncbi:clostripain-related cysteine peptidase [bacterium]|nr:clostripain-related cysteine peptidase [bacterium]
MASELVAGAGDTGVSLIELVGEPKGDRERVSAQVGAAAAWAREGGHAVLWLRGHGEPPRSGRDLRRGEYRLFGPGGQAECSVCDLKSALKGEQIDVVILEACYSASLEVLVDLAGTCRVLVGIPGEALGEGFPWGEVASGIAGLERGRERSPGAVVKALCGAISGSGPRGGFPWSISVIDMAGVGDLQRLVNQVGEEAGREIAGAARGVQWARERSALSETLGASCDLLDLSVGLEGSCGSLSVRTACSQLRVAVEASVRANIPMMTGTDRARSGRGGVTVFMPSIGTETIDGYAARAGARIGAGWASFVERYLRYGRELVPLRVP